MSYIPDSRSGEKITTWQNISALSCCYNLTHCPRSTLKSHSLSLKSDSLQRRRVRLNTEMSNMMKHCEAVLTSVT